MFADYGWHSHIICNRWRLAKSSKKHSLH